MLAQYKSRQQYAPAHGDFVVWSGWITTWHGVVSMYDDSFVYVIFAGVPFLLVTMDESEQEKNTRKIPISKIRKALNGEFAILQQDPATQTPVWYV